MDDHSEHTHTEYTCPREDESLGEYLRRLRELRGLSLTDALRRSESLPKPQRITPDWLSRAERDRYQQPSSEKLRILAQLYRVPATWILDKAGLQSLPADIPAGDGVDQYQQWPADIQLLALRATELSPVAVKQLLEMANFIKELEKDKEEDDAQVDSTPT